MPESIERPHTNVVVGVATGFVVLGVAAWLKELDKVRNTYKDAPGGGQEFYADDVFHAADAYYAANALYANPLCAADVSYAAEALYSIAKTTNCDGESDSVYFIALQALAKALFKERRHVLSDKRYLASQEEAIINCDQFVTVLQRAAEAVTLLDPSGPISYDGLSNHDYGIAHQDLEKAVFVLKKRSKGSDKLYLVLNKAIRLAGTNSLYSFVKRRHKEELLWA